MFGNYAPNCFFGAREISHLRLQFYGPGIYAHAGPAISSIAMEAMNSDRHKFKVAFVGFVVEVSQRAIFDRFQRNSRSLQALVFG